jgi:hypothetical protein|eukprot:COSAG01_NODE_21611_length_893_cov_10.163728_2_plen_102_part_00
MLQGGHRSTTCPDGHSKTEPNEACEFGHTDSAYNPELYLRWVQVSSLPPERRRLWVRGEVMGSQKYGDVGKSQWVLIIMINRIISPCTRTTGVQILALGQT